jgi:hypothetical protein
VFEIGDNPKYPKDPDRCGPAGSILATAAAAQNNHREFFAQALATRRAVAHRAQLGHLAQPENRVMDVYPTGAWPLPNCPKSRSTAYSCSMCS